MTPNEGQRPKKTPDHGKAEDDERAVESASLTEAVIAFQPLVRPGVPPHKIRHAVSKMLKAATMQARKELDREMELARERAKRS